MKHQSIFIIVFLLLIPVFLFGQQEYTDYDFCRNSTTISNTGMIVLGSWAIGNMAIGAYGWKQNTGQKMYFHQMNVFWNVVNLSIAGISLYNNWGLDCSSLSPSEFLENHLNTERILLINSGLDLCYIGVGFLLNHLSKKTTKNPDLLKGYGNSLYLQGGFLLAFDLILYGLMRSERFQLSSDLAFNFSVNLSEIRLAILF